MRTLTIITNSTSTYPAIRFYAGSTLESDITIATSSGILTTTIEAESNPHCIVLAGLTETNVFPAVIIGGNGGNNGNFAATSGIQLGVSIGNQSASAGRGQLLFNPASGTASFIACVIAPTIDQTVSASGSYTGLAVQVKETALLGTANKLLSLAAGTAGTTVKLDVSNTGIVTTYGGNATTKGGVASTLNTSIKTAQSAALSASALVASTPSAGMWRISFVASITTAATAAGVLGGTTGFTVTYTNGNGDSVSKTTALSTPLGIGASNSTGDSASGDLYCYASSGSAITFSYGYTAGTGTPMQYDIAVYAEFLG